MPAMSSKDSITMGAVLARLNQLPMLSVVVNNVLASFKDGSLDSATLAHKIAQDQGLSTKVLRLANSSFEGLSRKIGSIQDAVIVMGFNRVRSLVLSAGFVQAFPPPGSLFDRCVHWQCSFRVACYAKALAQCLNEDQPLAFTGGKFHDIGLLVLDVCIPQQFADVLQQQKIPGLRLIEIEQSKLGFEPVFK
jgi:HD-like signal output (HDOD) protein